MNPIPVLVTLEESADLNGIRELLAENGLNGMIPITNRIVSGSVSPDQVETLKNVLGVQSVERERQNRTLAPD